MTALAAAPAAAGTYETVGPGLAGFIAIFALAVATVLLFRSMTRHLRKVRYGPTPEDGATPDPEAPADAAEAAPGRAEDGAGTGPEGTGAKGRGEG